MTIKSAWDPGGKEPVGLLLPSVPIDSDRDEKVHKSCSVARWKESYCFTLQKLPLKLAFIGKLTTSLNTEYQSGSFSERLTAGWRDFHQCSQYCFIASKMFLSWSCCQSSNFNWSLIHVQIRIKHAKRTFVCSSGKGRLCCAVSLGRKLLLYLANTKASGHTPPLAGGPAVFTHHVCPLNQTKIQRDSLIQVYQHGR